MGTQLSLSSKGHSPQLSSHICCGQTAGWIKMPVGREEVGLGASDIVLDEDPAPPPPKRHNCQFAAHVCCSPTVGWIKMPLSTEVGLGTGHIVLHRDQTPPHFWPMSIVAKGRRSQVLLSTYLTQGFWATVCKTVRPMLWDRCLSVLSVCLSVCLPVCL